MKEEVKDPALGTIVENKIKVTAEPGEPTIHVREKEHKGNPYKLAIAIMTVIIFALIAGILYLLFCPLAKPDEDDAANQPSCPEQVVCENTLKEEEAVKEVIAKVDQAIEDLLVKNKLSRQNLYQVYDMGGSYQPEGMIVGVPMNKSYGILINTDNLTPGQTLYNLVNNYTIYQTIENALINAGLTNTNQKYTTASAGPGATSFVNNTSGVVCSADSSSVHCAYKTWYNQDDAKLSNTLAEIYKTATGKDAHYLVAKVDNIKDSPIAPYQRIEVGMPGFGASFYRTSSDAEWQFFAAGQSAPACSEYNTEDLRKAFAGTSCFPDNPGPMETVQP